jgi:threonine dehydratase
MSYVAGVDGCPGGWIAVYRAIDGRTPPRVALHSRFSDIFLAAEEPSVIAVDMPIGLPDAIEGGGRGPEQALRKVLGARQSSVFCVPSRAAVYAPDYAAACAAAERSSLPPRKVSKQAFHLFPKIRELDGLLREDPARAAVVHETHPEGVFALLKGSPLSQPKKLKSSPWAPGLAERRQLLETAGLPADLLLQKPPRGAAADDLLDACACSVAALKILAGTARIFAGAVATDAYGLRIAIHA